MCVCVKGEYSLPVSCVIHVYQSTYKDMFAILPLQAQPIFNETLRLLNNPMANSTLP